MGVETDSAAGGNVLMVTVIPADQSEITSVWMAHLALAFTAYVPGFNQVFPTLITPKDNHPEFVPSPQSN
jgi:hypothetical protein